MPLVSNGLDTFKNTLTDIVQDSGLDTCTTAGANKNCGFYSVIGAKMEYHWIHNYGSTLCSVGCIN